MSGLEEVARSMDRVEAELAGWYELHNKLFRRVSEHHARLNRSWDDPRQEDYRKRWMSFVADLATTDRQAKLVAAEHHNVRQDLAKFMRRGYAPSNRPLHLALPDELSLSVNEQLDLSEVHDVLGKYAETLSQYAGLIERQAAVIEQQLSLVEHRAKSGRLNKALSNVRSSIRNWKELSSGTFARFATELRTIRDELSTLT